MLVLTWSDGGQAQLLQTDGDQARFRSSRPFPPGCPVECRNDEGHSYRLKVRSSRKLDDGALPFRVEARFVNLSRTQREQLKATFDTIA